MSHWFFGKTIFYSPIIIIPYKKKYIYIQDILIPLQVTQTLTTELTSGHSF